MEMSSSPASASTMLRTARTTPPALKPGAYQGEITSTRGLPAMDCPILPRVRAMAVAPRKIVYLVGTTRCGSTLIGSLLGQVPGAVHVGELARIWQEGMIDNVRCGCG